MPMSEVVRDNFPRLVWMAGSFLAGFGGAVLVFRSKLTILAENQKKLAEDIRELKAFNFDIGKDKKMIESRVDEIKHANSKVCLSLTSCQEGAKEWRTYQKEKERDIFQILGTIQEDIKQLIGEVVKK
jgi:demethoxyubiquinone hydroxylase (CLK1/Coq7/Cat5 family)